MSDINLSVIHGRLTRDPEIRFGPSGSALASFTVASNHKYRNRTGRIVEEASFVPCVVFGQAAEWVRDHHKGEVVIVSGRLKTQSWEKDGASRSRLVLIVDGVQFPSRQKPEPSADGDMRERTAAMVDPSKPDEDLFSRCPVTASVTADSESNADKIPF